MTIRQRLGRALAIGAATAVLVGLGVLGEAGVATAQAHQTTSTATAAASSFSCAQDYWCDYIYDNGTGLCFKVSPFAGPGNIPKLVDVWVSQCRRLHREQLTFYPPNLLRPELPRPARLHKAVHEDQ